MAKQRRSALDRQIAAAKKKLAAINKKKKEAASLKKKKSMLASLKKKLHGKKK